MEKKYTYMYGLMNVTNVWFKSDFELQIKI